MCIFFSDFTSVVMVTKQLPQIGFLKPMSEEKRNSQFQKSDEFLQVQEFVLVSNDTLALNHLERQVGKLWKILPQFNLLNSSIAISSTFGPPPPLPCFRQVT